MSWKEKYEDLQVEYELLKKQHGAQELNCIAAHNRVAELTTTLENAAVERSTQRQEIARLRHVVELLMQAGQELVK